MKDLERRVYDLRLESCEAVLNGYKDLSTYLANIAKRG